MTAVEIAARVRAGQVDPVAVTRESLERIAQRDGAIGAFVKVRADKAIAEAELLTAHPDVAKLPLAGVPIAIKDNVPVAGEPMTIGSEATSRAPQLTDHTVVRRLRAAGAVVVGLTAVPELCMWGTTDNPATTTRNPWNEKRTPGGSSGGIGGRGRQRTGGAGARKRRSRLDPDPRRRLRSVRDQTRLGRGAAGVRR